MFGLGWGGKKIAAVRGTDRLYCRTRKNIADTSFMWLRAGILVTSLQPPVLNSLHLEGRPADTRVVVAMSGGVNSSVVAALLKAEGYDVVGITLQLYDHGEAVGRKGACCAGQDIQDARRVADRLKIPHYVLDYESALRQGGDGRVRRQLSPGRDAGPLRRLQPEDQVPRPAGDGRGPRRLCARDRPLCQERARRRAGGSSTAPPTRSATRAISCSPPRASSSAFSASRSAASKKDETRKLARDFGLAVAEKSDSQDICFVPTGRYTQVIERLRPGAAEAGNIVHVDGRVLGRHGGIINYTIGQRKGIGVPAKEPLYVLKLDASAREVVVGPRECLRMRTLKLRDMNWLGDEALRGFRGLGRGDPRPDPIERAVAAGALEHRGRRFDGRARSWRGRRVTRTGLRFLCRAWRRGAASRRRMDQVRGRSSRVGQKRLCGIRGKKRNRRDAGGRIAVGAVQSGA